LVTVPVSIERIPAFPPLAVEILSRIPSLTNAPDSDLPSLIRTSEGLGEEIVLTGIRKGLFIDTADQIPMLDLAEIALSILVRQYMQRTFDLDEDRRYWRYTLACAFTCKELARLDGQNGVRAYAAGLLHDIGRLALIAAYPEKYANLLALTNSMFASGREFDISEYERLLFGLDRFATGDWLASSWNLPAWLHPVVGKFHQRPAAEGRELMEIVRAGTQMAHSLGFGYLEDAPRTPVAEILSKLPVAFRRWEALQEWRLGQEAWRARIEPRLAWY
jgi:hypothetical protein